MYTPLLAEERAGSNVSNWLVLIVLSIMGVAIFSAAETAFTAMNRLRLKVNVEQGDKIAEKITWLLNKPERLLATTLVSINLCTVATSSLISSLVLSFYRGTEFETISVVLAPFVTTLLLMTFGEIIPKTIAINRADMLSKYLHIPIRIFFYLLLPVIFLLSNISKGILALFKVQSNDPLTMDFSRQDLRKAIRKGEEMGVLDAHEEKLLGRVLALSSMLARDIMVPRVNIVATSVNTSYQALVSISQNTGLSRIVIFDGDISNTVGFVFVLDLLLVTDMGQTAGDLMHDLAYYPETKPCDELLEDMKATHISIAGIINEYGTLLGIVTMEDLLEALFGEIQDEFDKEEDKIKKIKDDTYSVMPSASIDEINEALNVNLPNSPDYESISGFLLNQMKRIPKKDDKYIHHDSRLEFTINQASERRIEEITIRKLK